MWSKLKIRLLSAGIGSVAVLLLIFAPVWVFNIGVAAVAYTALYELYSTFKQEKKWQVVVLDYLAATALMGIAVYSGGRGRMEFMLFILVIYIMLLLVCAIIWNDKIKFYDVTSSLFMLCYSVLFIIHLVLIRRMDNGLILIFLPLLGAWMPDTFAYFTGVMFGRHKLIPSISPKKTVEGSVGAVVGCVVIFLLYGCALQYFCRLDISYPRLVGLALLCGVAAQFGDLAASLMKRECEVKDFGNLIPGHGGILDRIDSLIFTAPLVYYFDYLFPIF